MTDLDLHAFSTLIRQGGVVAYPTEAVWGLGCDPWNREAVQRILMIKNRPEEKGLILVGANEQQFAPLLDVLNSSQREKLSNTWPGPVTWLIPDLTGWVPTWVRGQFDTVAVRVSHHPVVKQLCLAAGQPLVSTSANLAGEAPLLTREQVITEFRGTLDLVIEGKTGEQAAPSEIRDLQTGRVIRPG